ncbi:hypothetical protein HH214_14825 [Mucilaginibacter robiniae]|uniref:Damage-inducible protein DinB n=1 Tax=Mucilaginibacter robiniae TaxID=2728022 RepID=A0A7L5E0Z8_9SPHI|nr:DinB family protein [Mucilaginibacter robiniae]QJD97050.1 hypothetical protein HH214_14825 [Mucilaginibacter robiniae]
MYYHINDFLTDWELEAGRTHKIFSNITEDTKAVKINPKVRTLERLAWHLVQSITEMGTRAGLFDHDELEHETAPLLFADIIVAHQKYNALLAEAVKSRWTDNHLNETVNMYGEEWTKATILSVLIGHEAHHRSQMTVVMRMLDLPVPGLYGPSQEEWAQIGVSAME